MALVPAAYAAALTSAIQAALGTAGGPELSNLTLAIGTGVINTALALQGQIGTPAASGVSAGVGITGISASDISATIVSEIEAVTGVTIGAEGQDIMDAIGSVTVSQFALAVLASDANGNAAFASFSGSISTMSAAIQAASSFSGDSWPDICDAVAKGVCDEIGSNGAGVLAGATGPAPPGSGVVVIT